MNNEVMETGTKALVEITEGEINVQIATAKRFPRSLDTFRKKALSLATDNKDIAARCFYKLKRGGKIIEGPSVRLAEICAGAWQNLRSGSRIIEIGLDFVRSQGACHDLENNNAVSVETLRRIVDSDGVRYNQDMIGVTCNAANAIAFRNAVNKIIPNAYIQEIFLACKKTAVGDQKTLTERRAQMVERFGAKGIKENKLLEYVGRKTLDEIDLQDLEDLIGAYTAIEDGDTTAEETFGADARGGKPAAHMPKSKAQAAGQPAAGQGTQAPANGQPAGNGEGRESKPAAEKKPEPETIMDERQFAINAGIVINKLKKAGKTDANIASALVRKGYIGDPLQAEEKERKAVLALLESMVE